MTTEEQITAVSIKLGDIGWKLQDSDEGEIYFSHDEFPNIWVKIEWDPEDPEVS